MPWSGFFTLKKTEIIKKFQGRGIRAVVDMKFENMNKKFSSTKRPGNKATL